MLFVRRNSFVRSGRLDELFCERSPCHGVVGFQFDHSGKRDDRRFGLAKFAK